MPNSRPSLREGGASWSKLIDPADPSSGRRKRIALPSNSSSIASVPQAAGIRATVTPHAGAGPNGDAISIRPPMRPVSSIWNASTPDSSHARGDSRWRNAAALEKAGLFCAADQFQFLIPTPGSSANMIRPSLPHHKLQPPELPSALRRARISLLGIHPSLSK